MACLQVRAYGVCQQTKTDVVDTVAYVNSLLNGMMRVQIPSLT